MSDSLRVVLVEDHDLVREGLRTILEQQADITVVGEATTVEGAVAEVLRTEPALVVLDLRLGEEHGTAVARRLRSAGAATKILVLSVHDSSRDLREALAAGADGYLLKSVSGAGLAEGIRKAVAGDTVIGEEFVPKLLADAARGPAAQPEDVTTREQEVLELIAEGLANRSIGERLGISTRTVQKHVENLFSKLGVHDRTELVTRAFRAGLLG
jgi:DNA-binding NarL/FixJ family response regulator